jgi:hypothetical protein
VPCKRSVRKAGYYDVRSTEMSRYPRRADGQRQTEKPNKIKQPKMFIYYLHDTKTLNNCVLTSFSAGSWLQGRAG